MFSVLFCILAGFDFLRWEEAYVYIMHVYEYVVSSEQLWIYLQMS